MHIISRDDFNLLQNKHHINCAIFSSKPTIFSSFKNQSKPQLDTYSEISDELFLLIFYIFFNLNTDYHSEHINNPLLTFRILLSRIFSIFMRLTTTTTAISHFRHSSVLESAFHSYFLISGPNLSV